MGQNLISTLMDTTLRLEGVVNNIQHLKFFQCVPLVTLGTMPLEKVNSIHPQNLHFSA